MNYNIFNMIIILLGVCVGLWETILEARGKRILKGSHEIIGLANLGVMAHLLSQVFDNTQSLMLSAFALVLIYGLIRYYFGMEYRVHSQKPELLAELIETALREIEGIKPERKKEKEIVRFTTKDSTKVVELKEKNATWSSKKNYYINFKRWLNYESRKEILTFIENTLGEEEEYEQSKIKIALQALALVIVIGGMIFLTSMMVMQPSRLSKVVPDELPEAVRLIKTNEIYEDKDIIKELHKSFENSFALSSKSITKDSLLGTSEVTLNYASNNRIIYIGRNTVFLFVDDAEIGNKSIFHRISWKIHKLYDKSSGAYYRVYSESRKMNEYLDDIIGSN